MTFIYVLKLTNDKFYIGKTENPRYRLENHFSQKGAAWTRKYRPVELFELIPDCDAFDEDKYTIKYMKKYGMQNVRGGSFCEILMSNENTNTVNRMITGSEDKCYKCGNSGHFANKCTQNKRGSTKQKCTRCNRYGHTIKKCYANTCSNGDEIDSESDSECWGCSNCTAVFDSEKGARFHERRWCKFKPYKCTLDKGWQSKLQSKNK